MSTRNIRKALSAKNKDPPIPKGSSSDEYEPLYATKSHSSFDFKELANSSHSHSEVDENVSEASEEKAEPPKLSKKNKKKKRQRKNKKTQVHLEDKAKCSEIGAAMEVVTPRSHSEVDKNAPEASEKKSSLPNVAKKNKKKNRQIKNEKTPQDKEKRCEIAAAMKEMNISSLPESSVSINSEQSDDLMVIQQKHLNADNELRRLGLLPADQSNKIRGKVRVTTTMWKKGAIVPLSTYSNFQKNGLSMSVEKREGGYTYFTFDHNEEYQQMHREFIQIMRNMSTTLYLEINTFKKTNHVEGLLEIVDDMFYVGEISLANNNLKQCIAYLQYVAHPFFALNNSKVRLDYKYMENRPFHVAVLKYLYLLTNKACHRTALELAKVLLNLDPTDPLAVIFIIDTLALRAREYQWLVDIIDKWSKEKDADFLFNIKYSQAMAYFHLSCKNKELGKDLRQNADRLLESAIMHFPTVVTMILEYANMNDGQLKLRNLYKYGKNSTTQKLKDLISIYAKLTYSWWKEQAVFNWFIGIATEVADNYDRNTDMQNCAETLGNERVMLFQIWPPQIIRHIYVIKSMANLLFGEPMALEPRMRAANPHPPIKGINRYKYECAQTVENRTGTNGGNFLQVPQQQNPVLEEARAVAARGVQEVNAVDRGNIAGIDENNAAENPPRPGYSYFMAMDELTHAVRSFFEGQNVRYDDMDSSDDE